MTRGTSPSGQIVGLTAATVTTALALLLAVTPGEGSVAGLLLLGAAVTLTELRPVHVGRGGERQSFTLTEGPLVAALALAPGRWTVVAVVAGILLAQVRRQLPVYKVAFNTAQFAAATAAACLIAQQVEGDQGVLLGILAFVLVNDTLVRLVLKVATGQSINQPLAGASWAWALHVLAITSTALLASHTFAREPALLPAFAAPALLILWSQEQSTRRRARTTVDRALTEQAREMYAGRAEDTAALVTRTVRQLLAGSRVELLTLQGLRVSQTVDTGAEPVHSSQPHGVLGSGWPARVLATPAGAVHGHHVGIALGGEQPTALLSAWRDPAQEPFRQDDLVVLRTLADELAAWLARGPGPEDDATVPPAQELSAHGADAASALDAVRRVRQRLESEPLPGTSDGRVVLADDLLAAEEQLRRLIGAMTSPRADDEDDVVAIGRWRSA